MTSARSSISDAGFTLLELMVVIFIIGLMASVVIVNLPEPTPGVSREAERTERIMRMASAEAIVAGEPIGWKIEDGGHVFQRYRFGKWEGLDSGPLSMPDQLVVSRGLSVQVVSDRDNAVRDSDRDRKTDKETVFTPDLVFFPTGEASGVRLLITGPSGDRRLRVDSSGTVRPDDTPL